MSMKHFFIRIKISIASQTVAKSQPRKAFIIHIYCLTSLTYNYYGIGNYSYNYCMAHYSLFEITLILSGSLNVICLYLKYLYYIMPTLAALSEI